MKNFKKSLGLLDKLIQKLEANVALGNPICTKNQKSGKIQKEQVNKKKNKNNKPKKPKKQKISEKDADLALFAKADLRVGEILDVKEVEGSDKLYIETISFGGDEKRTILSGLRHFVPIGNMTGKCVVFYNLKPRPLAGHVSNGMVMCSSNNDHTEIDLLRPPQDAPLGSRVHLMEKELEVPEVISNMNSKKLKKFLPKLNTDENGLARYREYYLGVEKAQLLPTKQPNGNIS